MRTRGWLVGVALLVTSASAGAQTDVRTTVRAATTCQELAWSAGALVELLRVELASDHVTIADDPSAPLTVTATPDVCSERARGATLVVVRDGTKIERWVDLEGVAPNARARALALAAAAVIREALATQPPPRTLSIRVEIVPPPAPPTPPPPPPTPPKAPEAPPPGRAFALALSGEARAFPSARTGLFGARIAASIPLGPIALTFDAGAAFGGTEDALGSVEVTAAGGGAGVALATGTERLRLLVGPRLELDWVRFVATANGPGTIASRDAAAALALTLSATGFVALAHGAWVVIGLDAGTTLLGYTAIAATRPVAGVDGPMLGVRIGAAWSSGLP